MLEIEIPGREFYDEERNEFFDTKPVTLRLEHSLVSISKWEAKWKKPFLTREPHSLEETRDYVRCMTLNQHVDPAVYRALTPENVDEVAEYISAELTATTIHDTTAKPTREIVTSEVMYYWMIVYNIPIEAQKWHLSRFLTLVRICSIKNAPPKKMSRQAILRRNTKLNEARRKKLGTRG